MSDKRRTSQIKRGIRRYFGDFTKSDKYWLEIGDVYEKVQCGKYSIYRMMILHFAIFVMAIACVAVSISAIALGLFEVGIFGTIISIGSALIGARLSKATLAFLLSYDRPNQPYDRPNHISNNVIGSIESIIGIVNDTYEASNGAKNHES